MAQYFPQKVWHRNILRATQLLSFKNRYQKNTIFTKKAEKIYDELYHRFDFDTSPFGYDVPYISWRKSKINRTIVSHAKKGRLLDNGGGYGFLHQFLGDPSYEYYNLDCSFEMLKYDKSNCRVLGWGEALPFKNDSFDTVVSGDVLEHTQDKLTYLEEAHRVLKRGGIFILNTPRTGWRRSYVRSAWFWIPLLSDFYSHVKKKAQKETPSPPVPDVPSDEVWLRKQLEALGYEIVVQSRTDNHLFVFTHAFWRRVADAFIDPGKYGHCAFFVCRKR